MDETLTAHPASDVIADAIGYRVRSCQDGKCELEWRPPPSWINPDGAVFGGVVAALMDAATGMAVESACEPRPDLLPTASLHVDYLRPMTSAVTYTCLGEVLRIGRRLAVADARIYDDAGNLVVRGTATLALINAAVRPRQR